MLEKNLPYVSDVFPIALAVVGIILSYHAPDKHQKVKKAFLTIFLLLAGITGSAMQVYVRRQTEDEHREELAIQKATFENTRKLSKIASAPMPQVAQCVMDISKCSNRDIEQHALQLAAMLEQASAKYAQFESQPVAPGLEKYRQQQLETMMATTSSQYNQGLADSVAKYRNEMVRRLSLIDSAKASDYLYDNARAHPIADFQLISGDLRSLASKLK